MPPGVTISRPKLAPVPSDPRAKELWLQHLAGSILFRDARGYAVERIDPKLSADPRVAAQKAVDDALYGVMMIVDGVTGAVAHATEQVELRVLARRVRRRDGVVLDELDLADGDGMCMGYHGWLEGNYGQHPIVSGGRRPPSPQARAPRPKRGR